MLMSKERVEKVIDRIRELDLTNKEVADSVPIDERSLYRWLSRQREPKVTFLQAANLCSKLNWTIQELADAFYSSDSEITIAAEPGGDYATN